MTGVQLVFLKRAINEQIDQKVRQTRDMVLVSKVPRTANGNVKDDRHYIIPEALQVRVGDGYVFRRALQLQKEATTKFNGGYKNEF